MWGGLVDGIAGLGLNTLMARQVAKIYSPLSWIRRHKLYSLLLFIVLLVAGIFVYQKVALELNRRAFAQARTTIDAVYADIVAQVGQPDDYRRDNICRTTQEVYGEGALSCYVTTDLILGVEDKQQSDQFINKIKDIISMQSNFILESEPTIPSVNTSAGSDSEPSRDYYKTNKVIECVVSYVFEPTFNTLLIKKVTNKKTLYVSIDCTAGAKGAFYQKQ